MPADEPTIDRLRAVMRTLLAERLSLKLHEEEKGGALDRFVLINPDTPGPGIKLRFTGETCVKQDARQKSNTADPSKAADAELWGLALENFQQCA